MLGNGPHVLDNGKWASFMHLIHEQDYAYHREVRLGCLFILALLGQVMSRMCQVISSIFQVSIKKPILTPPAIIYTLWPKLSTNTSRNMRLYNKEEKKIKLCFYILYGKLYFFTFLQCNFFKFQKFKTLFLIRFIFSAQYKKCQYKEYTV